MISAKNVANHVAVLLLGALLALFLRESIFAGAGLRCPVSTGWGTCFEGVAVLVGVLNACAIIYLSWQANRIANSAGIERKDHDYREGKILLSYVVPELREAKVKLSVVAHLLAQDNHRASYATRQPVRQQISQILAGVSFPLTASILARMHVMPDPLGSALAQLLGVIRVARNAAEDASSTPTPGAERNSQGVLVESVEVTEEALDKFSTDYWVINSSVRLMIGEIERTMAADKVMRSEYGVVG